MRPAAAAARCTPAPLARTCPAVRLRGSSAVAPAAPRPARNSRRPTRMFIVARSLCLSSKRGKHSWRVHRDLPETHAGGIEHGISDGGGGAGLRCLAGAERLHLGMIDE